MNGPSERLRADGGVARARAPSRTAQLKEKGLVLFFNPLDETLTRQVRLPLYYTGLSDMAWIREQEQNAAQLYPLDRDYRVELAVTLPPRGVTWFLIGGSAAPDPTDK